MDTAESFGKLMQIKGWNASDLAGQLCVSPATVSRALSLLKLEPELKQSIRDGKLSPSAAYALARMAPEQRTAFVERAKKGEVPRDEVHAKVRKKPTGKRAPKISLSIGSSTIACTQTSIESIIAELKEFMKEAQKALQEGFDLTTLSRMLRDKLKHKST